MWFDLVCILIVVAGFVFGFRRGFFAQTGSVLGVILGVIGCRLFAGDLVAHFSAPDDSERTVLLTNIMTYVIVFAVIYFACRLAGSFLTSLFRALKFGFLEKLCGAVFTTLEYTLIFSLFLNAWIAVFPDTSLRSDYSGVKEFVLNFAPDIFGSRTARDILDSVQSSVSDVSSNLFTSTTE